MWSTIANHIQRHIRQPLQGEHCRSQRFYRHSVFSRLFTTPCRIHPICLSSPVESMSAPFRQSIQTNDKIHETIYSCLISLVSSPPLPNAPALGNGGAVGYRPPVHNDYSTSDSESSLENQPIYYSVLDWKLQVFRL